MINARHPQQLRDMGASEETIERLAREACERLAIDAEAFTAAMIRAAIAARRLSIGLGSVTDEQMRTIVETVIDEASWPYRHPDGAPFSPIVRMAAPDYEHGPQRPARTPLRGGLIWLVASLPHPQPADRPSSDNPSLNTQESA